MSEATAWGWDTYTAWLAGTSVMAAPVRSAIARCADGGIIRSCVVSRYRLGLIRQAASLIVPPSASTPQGIWESAINAAWPAGRSPAKDARNLSRSSDRKPSLGGRIGGCGPSAGKPAMSVLTDSPLSGAEAAMYTRAATLSWGPAGVDTAPPYEWPARTTGPSRPSMTRRVKSASPSSDTVG